MIALRPGGPWRSGCLPPPAVGRAGRGRGRAAPIGGTRTFQSLTLQICQSVEIAVSPSALFPLVCDPEARSRLDPAVRVIRVEVEGAGPLREGSIMFFRLQKGSRIFEYRTRCLRLVPERLLETQAELPTLFRVRVELVPIPGGTRLTQQEDCEVGLDMLEGLPVTRRAERVWRAMHLLHLVMPALARETFAVVLRERAEALRILMERELRAWLEAIKRHVESKNA